MLTGRHMVRDVSCKNCDAKLGWIYEFATEENQRYKEGRVILERALVTETDGIEEHMGDDWIFSLDSLNVLSKVLISSSSLLHENCITFTWTGCSSKTLKRKIVVIYLIWCKLLSLWKKSTAYFYFRKKYQTDRKKYMCLGVGKCDSFLYPSYLNILLFDIYMKPRFVYKCLAAKKN